MVDWKRIVADTAHRPWPLPARPWAMTMTWRDLLFAHWSFEPEEVRSRLPQALELDTFDGRAWVGVVPFRMERVGPRGLGALPARLPGPRAFPELNVRTYVRHQGKPGVWFWSLDAASAAAVWGGRTFFHLPYFRAEMTVRERGGWVEYRSRRTDRRIGAGELAGRYRPAGESFRARPGSLEHWLTERYCLYAVDRRGRVRRGEIHHPPWPLAEAEAEFEVLTVADAHALRLEGEPGGRTPLLHFAARLDVVAWWLSPVPHLPGRRSDAARDRFVSAILLLTNPEHPPEHRPSGGRRPIVNLTRGEHSMQKKRNLLLAAGTVVAMLIGGLLLPLTPIASAQTNLPLSYAAKFVCGVQSQNLDPRFPVARGFYATEINIYNQNKSEAKLEKQVLVLFDDTQPLGREPDQVPPTGFDGIALQPGQSTMDDCFGIRRILGMNPNATTLLIGFFTIRSVTTPITVDAVYTTGGTAGARLAVPAITVEHIQPVTVNP